MRGCVFRDLAFHQLHSIPPIRYSPLQRTRRFTRLLGNPIFIGGVPRSGTTLLRVVLDTHPRIFCGTELRAVHAVANLFAAAQAHSGNVLRDSYGVSEQALRDVFAELILSFFQPAWPASGKPRVAEKTPSNVLAFPQLRALFPDSPLVHVIRDVRDVVASRLERDRASGGAALDTVTTARARAREWVETMQVGRWMRADPARARAYHEVRYEELVQSPERALEPLFGFLGEPFDPVVLQFHRVARNVSGTEEWSADAVRREIFTSSIGRWRHSLSPAEIEAVVAEAGQTMTALGYATDP